RVLRRGGKGADSIFGGQARRPTRGPDPRWSRRAVARRGRARRPPAGDPSSARDLRSGKVRSWRWQFDSGLGLGKPALRSGRAGAGAGFGRSRDGRLGSAMIAALILASVLSQDYYTPQESQAVFQQANQAYDREDYASAKQAYQQLLAHGFEGADILFNLGTTCLAAGGLRDSALYL